MTHPPTKATRRALVVVVDPATRKACLEAFSKAGFTVTDTVNSGAAAVTIAREQHPDIIILNDQLTDVPAGEAVKWLRSNEQVATTPIVIVGGSVANNQRSIHDSIYALPRPFSAAAIEELINGLTHKNLHIG